MMTAIPTKIRNATTVRLMRAACLAAVGFSLCLSPLAAQTPAQLPASSAPASPAPVSPEPLAPADAQAVKVNEIAARPALVFEGQSTWEDGYTSLVNGFQRLRAELARVGLKAGGHPMSVFVSTDDAGFRFQAMAPLAEAPASTPDLGAEFKIGQTPSGRAVKFEHRGAYEEIDATYEAITAWLDEKNLDARDFFVEEFANLGNGPDDSNLSVDVFVFVK
jgi:effector-binding domain-containing protein